MSDSLEVPSLSITELKDMISTLGIRMCRHNVLLMGDHGIGKSGVLRSAFNEHPVLKDYPFFTLFLSTAVDPGDLTGIPYESDGKMQYSTPWWSVTDRPIIVFLDEVLRSRPEMMQPAFPLLNEREIMGRKFHPDTIIVSATNVGDGYIQSNGDRAFGSRFTPFMFRPTVPEWITWASTEGDPRNGKIDSRIIAYINDKGAPALDGLELREDMEFYERNPDRRSWVRVDDLLKAMGRGAIEPRFAKWICAEIGITEGMKFVSFANNYELISPIEILEADDFNDIQPQLLGASPDELIYLNDGMFDVFLTKATEYKTDKNLRTLVSMNFLNWLNFLEEFEHNDIIGSACTSIKSKKHSHFLMMSDDIHKFIDKTIDKVAQISRR